MVMVDWRSNSLMIEMKHDEIFYYRLNLEVSDMY